MYEQHHFSESTPDIPDLATLKQLNDTSFLHEIDKLHYPFSSEQFESEYDFILPFEDIATITEFWGIKCFTKMILLKYELW